MLSMAVITDIHHGPSGRTKLGLEALRLVGDFATFVEHSKPDIVVELGDRISDVDKASDIVLAREVGAALRNVPADMYHLPGNHDLAKLTRSENEEALGRPIGSRMVRVGGIDMVLWDTMPLLDPGSGFDLASESLEWLRATLADARWPTVIFTHVPLDNGSMIGNYYFDRINRCHAGYPEEQGEAIRSVIECSGKVIACINGHSHWNAYHCIDGIHYVTIPSLTEAFMTSPQPNAAWAIVRIDDTIDIEVSGLTAMAYRLPLRRREHHWLRR